MILKKISNHITGNTGFLIRLDDVAENMKWEFMDKIEILFDNFAIKPVLGVIPDNKDLELLSYPKKNTNFCLTIPITNKNNLTTITESFQSIVWHLLVSHPDLKKNSMKWENVLK